MKLMPKLLFAILSVIYVPGWAATATSAIAVSATVLSVCTVLPGTLVFGDYNGTEKSVTGSFTVTCTTGTGYSIALGAGDGASATTAERKMTSILTAGTLKYTLYKEVGHSNIWGDSGGDIVTGLTGTGLPVIHDVFGVIFADQYPKAAIDYTDSVSITVTY